MVDLTLESSGEDAHATPRQVAFPSQRRTSSKAASRIKRNVPVSTSNQGLGFDIKKSPVQSFSSVQTHPASTADSTSTLRPVLGSWGHPAPMKIPKRILRANGELVEDEPMISQMENKPPSPPQPTGAWGDPKPLVIPARVLRAAAEAEAAAKAALISSSQKETDTSMPPTPPTSAMPQPRALLDDTNQPMLPGGFSSTSRQPPVNRLPVLNASQSPQPIAIPSIPAVPASGSWSNPTSIPLPVKRRLSPPSPMIDDPTVVQKQGKSIRIISPEHSPPSFNQITLLPAAPAPKWIGPSWVTNPVMTAVPSPLLSPQIDEIDEIQLPKSVSLPKAVSPPVPKSQAIPLAPPPRPKTPSEPLFLPLSSPEPSSPSELIDEAQISFELPAAIEHDPMEVSPVAVSETIPESTPSVESRVVVETVLEKTPVADAGQVIQAVTVPQPTLPLFKASTDRVSLPDIASQIEPAPPAAPITTSQPSEPLEQDTLRIPSPRVETFSKPAEILPLPNRAIDPAETSNPTDTRMDVDEPVTNHSVLDTGVAFAEDDEGSERFATPSPELPNQSIPISPRPVEKAVEDVRIGVADVGLTPDPPQLVTSLSIRAPSSAPSIEEITSDKFQSDTIKDFKSLRPEGVSALDSIRKRQSEKRKALEEHQQAQLLQSASPRADDLNLCEEVTHPKRLQARFDSNNMSREAWRRIVEDEGASDVERLLDTEDESHPSSDSSATDRIETHLNTSRLVDPTQQPPPERRGVANRDFNSAAIDEWNRRAPFLTRNPALHRSIFEAYIAEKELESGPISVINNIDGEGATPDFEFEYSNEMLYHPDVPDPEKGLGCGCEGRCDPTSKTCTCLRRQQLYFYDLGIPGFAYDE